MAVHRRSYTALICTENDLRKIWRLRGDALLVGPVLEKMALGGLVGEVRAIKVRSVEDLDGLGRVAAAPALAAGKQGLCLTCSPGAGVGSSPCLTLWVSTCFRQSLPRITQSQKYYALVPFLSLLHYLSLLGSLAKSESATMLMKVVIFCGCLHDQSCPFASNFRC